MPVSICNDFFPCVFKVPEDLWSQTILGEKRRIEGMEKS